jgi:hypothetical protein
MTELLNDYQRFRGKCKELSEQACKDDSTLTLVRGHYFCPIWGTNEPHWWTVTKNGIIYDPSKLQFPSKGLGVYEEFNGYVECCECGKDMAEDAAIHASNYSVCSTRCYRSLVGV